MEESLIKPDNNSYLAKFDTMISSLWNWLWKLNLMGAFGVSMLHILALTISEQASAQITPDTTLGTESSVVTPNVEIRGLPSDRIDGGAIRGSNLFHSFQDFNVGEGKGVYFTNPQGIENILGRVTGVNRTEILGRLGVSGNANLFLLNPNGIVFGNNASLDVEGSFFATTASGISLGGQGYFNATQPQQSNLLSVSPGALFFNQAALQLGNIINSIEVRGANLQVNSDRTLALMGGTVNIDGGKLVAPSGRVELGGVAGENTVELFPIRDFFGLNFPQGVPQADVSLTNQAEVNVLSSSGGSIAVNAANLNISEGSQLLTGISGIGSPNTQAGDIKINATRIAIADGSKISNEVAQNAVGNSGNININADSLDLSNKSFLATSTNGQGNAGNLSINTGSLSVSDNSLVAANTNGKGNAGNITINAGDSISFDRGSAYTDVSENGKGQAGNFNITTESLSLTNGAQLIASTRNEGNAGDITINTGSLSVSDNSFLAVSANGQQGDAGNITIDARDTVFFGKGSRAYTDVTTKGNGGDIKIAAGSLFVTDGSLLAASTKGEGISGNITINASDSISFDGGSAYTDVSENGKGQAGNFNITTESLSLTNGAQLNASTKNQGNAGNININARKTATFDAGSAYTEVTGTGNGGDININTESLNVKNRAYLFSRTSGNGDAGNINITTNSLSVSDESILAASANGQGNAGNITINANDRVLFDQAGKVYTNVTGRGNGGDIKINTGSVSVTNSSLLDGGTSGVGDAGNITFKTNSFSVTNDSQVIASTSGVGDAGDININTDSLFVTNNSLLAASANGVGNAGNITIDARDTVSFDYGAQVYTDVNQLPFSDGTPVKGDGGNIKISSGSLFVTNGAQLISNTQDEGNAGNINIDTGSLSVTKDAFLASSANGQGNAGDININARDRVLFDKGSAFSNVGVCSSEAVNCRPSNNTIVGNGGDIKIEAPSLQLMNGSFLATGVGDDNILEKKVEGNAGKISIHLKDDLSLDQSFITTRLFANGKGKAGDIDISAGYIFSNQSLISASTQGQGNAGGVSLQATNAISLADSDISTAIQKGATGDAQGINIRARSLLLSDGAQLNAVTSGEGKAGDIFIDTTDKVSVSGTNTTPDPTSLFQNNIPPRFNSPPKFLDGVSSGIFTSTNSSGVGGNITVNTNTFSISDGAIVDARTTASGTGGVIKINTNTFEATSGGQLSAISSFGTGTAGSIILNATGNATISGSNPRYSDNLAQFGNQLDIYGKTKVANTSAVSGLTVSSSELGGAGNLELYADSLTLKNSEISARTQAKGDAGSIAIDVNGLFSATDSNITTAAEQSFGGAIKIKADDIRLYGDSDIITNVASGTGNGGKITLTADSIIAFNNSDILTFASGGGNGGDIEFKSPAFFGQNYKQRSANTALSTLNDLDLNDRVDVNASGAVSGVITLPDTSFIQNSLNELPENLIDTSNLIANSCIARTSRQQQGSFTITGSGGLPTRPGDALMSAYTFGNVRSVSNAYPSTYSTRRPWRKGDTIVEPQGVYRLSSGQLVLSRECSD